MKKASWSSAPHCGIPALAVRGPEMSEAYLASYYSGGSTPRRRAASLALALVVVALVLGMLLGLGVVPGLRKPEHLPMAIFSVLPPAQKATAPTKEVKKQNKAASGAAPPNPKPPTRVVAPPPPPTVPSAQSPPKIISLSKDQFAQSDIGSLPSHNGEGEGDKGSGKDAVAPYGPGQGPGGAPAYPVRWYREPTHAEMAFYEPKNIQTPAWANVECQMLEHYHVENCRQAGESPAGSGLSRALRLASWQFLVVPPMRNGKAMIGSWVTIHYEWRTYTAKPDASNGPGHPPPDDDSH